MNMFHDQHILHKWYVFVFFMPCPGFPMGILSVGSFPVQSGGSLMTFPALLCVES